MADERFPKQMLKWIPHHITEKGYPKITWCEGIRNTMSVRNIYDGQWKDQRQQHLDFRH